MTTNVPSTTSLPSARPQTHDAQLRKALIERYANLDRRSWLQRLRFYAKRASWVLVVNSSYLIKRLLDISVSTVAILVLAPLLLATAFAIRLESPGPVFF